MQSKIIVSLNITYIYVSCFISGLSNEFARRFQRSRRFQEKYQNAEQLQEQFMDSSL